MPDGEFLPPVELICVENYFVDFIKKNYNDRHVILRALRPFNRAAAGSYAARPAAVPKQKFVPERLGIPQLNINISYGDNDAKMKKDFFKQFTEMYTKAGFTNIKTRDSKQAPRGPVFMRRVA